MLKALVNFLPDVLFALNLVHLVLSQNALIPQGYPRIRFYAEVGYQGLILMHEADPRDYCFNLQFGAGTVSSVQTSGSCVILYSTDDCEGDHSLRVTHDVPALSYHNFDNKVRSFRGCFQEDATRPIEPKPQLSIADGPKHTEPLFNFYDLCWCRTLPNFLQNRISSAHTYGNCMRLWDREDCQGNVKQLNPYESHENLHLPQHNFGNVAKSISVCDSFENCIRFHGIVKNITFKFGGKTYERLNKNKVTRKVELGPQSILLNGGKTPMTRDYSARRMIKERYRFLRIPAFSYLHTLRVDEELPIGLLGTDGPVHEYGENQTSDALGGIGQFFSNLASIFVEQYDVDVPFLKEEAFRKSVKNAFTFQTRSGTFWQDDWVTSNMKTFSVREIINVPEKKSLLVRSFIDMMDNLMIPYDVRLIVFGTDHGRDMNTREVEEGLRDKGFKVLRRIGNRYVEAIVRGKLKANFGMRSYAAVDEKDLE